jgi:hypothetical protein
MAWRPVLSVTTGDSISLSKLTGRKVRTRANFVDLSTYDPVKPNGIGPATSIATDSEGFIGHIQHLADVIPVAFADSGSLPATLDQLMRKKFKVVRFNWPTFSRQFEIEA